jgi:uncharacterized protein YcfJ
MRTQALLLSFTALALAGCAHSPNTQRGAVRGGLAGGVLGGVIGHQSNHAKEGAIVGTVLGAILGAHKGSEEDLRQAEQGRMSRESQEALARRDAESRGDKVMTGRAVTEQDVREAEARAKAAEEEVVRRRQEELAAIDRARRLEAAQERERRAREDLAQPPGT